MVNAGEDVMDKIINTMEAKRGKLVRRAGLVRNTIFMALTC
jgi:hypothetical protein